MTLEELILATTPQMVYDKLVTIYEDYPIYPDDCTQCPLFTYFCETLPDESDTISGVYYTTIEIGPRYHREFYSLPSWMNDYQNRMVSQRLTTMGEAVALLVSQYKVVA